MPCLGAYMIWKLFAGAEAVRNVISPAPRARLSTASRPTPSGFEHAWLAQVYPQLVRWHAYWMKNRNAWRIDGGRSTKTGLLSWGSNPVAYEFPQLVPYNQILQHTRQSAMYESGLDNSPLFDGVEFNEEKNCLELEDVALSSFYAMDCEALANIASYLGQRQDAARYRREHAKIARLINERLWDEEHGLYVNRHWAREGEAPAEPHSSHAPAGRYSDRWAPTSFFPLLAGVATPERAARMVREHLLNPREFWGEWVIPAIARSDPAYKDNDYWRGRIWGPFNFLVAEGLRRYRFDAEAAELAQKSLKLFMTNYRADGGVYENYNAETGQGADVWNAARLYHWGGLLAFIAMQELIDIEPNPAPGYLRVGSLDLPDAALQNVRLGGDLYDIQLDHGVHLKRAGQVILDCTTRAIVRVPLGAGGGCGRADRRTRKRRADASGSETRQAARAAERWSHARAPRSRQKDLLWLVGLVRASHRQCADPPGASKRHDRAAEAPAHSFVPKLRDPVRGGGGEFRCTTLRGGAAAGRRSPRGVAFRRRGACSRTLASRRAAARRPGTRTAARERAATSSRGSM